MTLKSIGMDEAMISSANGVVVVKRAQNDLRSNLPGDAFVHNEPPFCGEAGTLPPCTPWSFANQAEVRLSK